MLQRLEQTGIKHMKALCSALGHKNIRNTSTSQCLLQMIIRLKLQAYCWAQKYCRTDTALAQEEKAIPHRQQLAIRYLKKTKVLREMNEGTEATLTLSRTRLPNFSSDETEILFTEVETMFHRRTAGNRDPFALRSNWQEIADKISAVSGMAREPKHLKKKLNDLRRRVRTRLAKIQADKRTGGAQLPPSRLSRLDERVFAIMPDLTRSAVTRVDTLHMQLRSLEEGCSYCLDGSSCWAHDILTGGDNQSTSSLDRLMEEGHATSYLLHRQGVTAPKGQSGPGARNMRSHEKAAPKIETPISEGRGREAGPPRGRLGTGSFHAEFVPSREPAETPASHPRHSTQASPQRVPLQGQKEAEWCISSHKLLAFQQGLKGAMESGFRSIGSHLTDIHRDLVRLESTMSRMSDRLDANFATLAEALQERRPTSAPTPPESVRPHSSVFLFPTDTKGTCCFCCTDLLNQRQTSLEDPGTAPQHNCHQDW
ncbi:hypothetical protein AOXY_G10576 [Acipenser oxyrinchus oxyrinchus]|uniref:Myb/SANT-like DNA-binding domain-containing protein n=1 Tax=Acipenser oxyrinchus oxyrinchus TaxID=40147 RepID=A0AAD8G4P6_ACIOX|nr:hypothetical protein AOXY_G10576 [Acipenser oxyrinchus oxyrinchus]